MSSVRGASTRLGALLARVRRARLFRDAFWVLLFSVSSKALMFFGSAHAARCLGPANMGISAQIQVLVQQLGLAYNGGFDSVAVRMIAHERGEALPTLSRVVGLRLGVGLLLALAWLLLVPDHHPGGALHTAWLLGAPLLVIGGLNTGFLFQGIRRLPLYTAISSAGSAVTALAYLLWFTPGMPVGSDLVVSTLVSGATGGLALLTGAWLLRKEPDARAAVAATFDWPQIRALLLHGWRYWVLAILVYLYAGFPLLLISHFRDDSAAGVYRVAFLMAGAIELLFGSINNLLLAHLVEWRKESLHTLWSRQGQLLPLHLVLGLASTVAAIALAPWFFERFLGSRFAESVLIFQILASGRAVVFVGQIYAYGLIALHLDTPFLLATVAGTVTSLGFNLALIPRHGALAAAGVNVLSEAVTCLLCFWFERRHVVSEIRSSGGA